MQQRFLFAVSVAIFATFHWGCQPEPIPGYIRIEPFVVDATGGAAIQKLTDAWVYVNGELLGAYTLPHEFPALAEGKSEVAIFPGVKVNGIANTPNIYPFFKRFLDSIEVVPGEVVSVTPVIRYEQAIKFAYPEESTTFDTGNQLTITERDDDPATTFLIDQVGAFSGRSLRMPVDTTNPIIEISTAQVELPITGDRKIWLELHHKNDMPFELFLIGDSDNNSGETVPIFLFNAMEAADLEWNKIYIDLTDFVVQMREQRYRLYFRTVLPLGSDGKYSQIKGTVWLDNIRLLHFI
jgi:hypothetical protein